MSKRHIKDLGDGLVMRRGRAEDAEELADFQAELNTGPGEPSEGLRVWTLNLISQRWSYGGVEFDVGRIELVATHPDYRRRGLVRAQMEVVHEWCAERGELLQSITGIP